MRSHWIKLVVIFVTIWVVVGAVIFFARSQKVTPKSVAKYLDTHPMEGSSPMVRAKVIEKLADQINRLGQEERRGVRMGRGLDGFFRGLTPEEQGRFLDLTLPTGFQQMIEALNKMNPVQRQKFVDKALADMKQREGDRPKDEQLDANAKKIIEQGFKTFYSSASVDVKMDVAPLIEQIQRNLQERRRGE